MFSLFDHHLDFFRGGTIALTRQILEDVGGRVEALKHIGNTTAAHTGIAFLKA